MAQVRIIVVEDEPDISEVVVYNLRREGYEVQAFNDGEKALGAIRREPPALVLLDLMLPGLDGHEICRRLRADALTARLPVIMVTARSEESDVILGLGLGADDYIAKPFSARELVARVKAVLRRGGHVGVAGERIIAGEVVIDPVRHQVLLGGVELLLTATEFRLIHVLASHPGRVFTRDQLLGRVIGDGAIVIDRNIDVHVRSVRKKLGEQRDIIETVRGVGYRFRDGDS
jgi:two-component system phosphate regulon response regulator PhoB